MIYNMYELHPIYKNGCIYKNPDKTPTIVMIMDTGENNFLDYMKAHYNDELCYRLDDIQLDETYYLVPEKGYSCYVFSAHKGWAFWDVAEHDDRVVIAVELDMDRDKMHI